MNPVLSFEEYLKEYNSFHVSSLMSNQEQFTVSYEVELSARSHTDDYYTMLESFENVFRKVIDKYDMNVIPDNSLTDNGYYTGVEMVPENYFNGINEAFSFLDDFFKIYDKQKQFFFSNKTGFHINIGYKPATYWNIVKGYLLLNDEYSYTGFEDRKNSHYAESFKTEFKSKASRALRRQFPDIDSKFYNNNIDKFEPILNKVIVDIVKDKGEKYVGFNVNKLPQNYLEFRYPGGKLTKDVIENQTKHYANIVLAITDPEYRKTDYIRKMLKFLGEIFVQTK
jgi:hypothetical protein